MRSANSNHIDWLLNYAGSSFFECEERYKCGCFHVLSPVLHDMGLLKSYRSYASVILKTTATVFSEINAPRILVAGIDSEESAKGLVGILALFNKPFRLTFLDRCHTPLNRIAHYLKKEAGNYIETIQLDLLAPGIKKLFSCFDIVFADLLVKQFPALAKQELVTTLGKFLQNNAGRLIIREYIGESKQLLTPFARQLEEAKRLLLQEVLPGDPARIRELFNCLAGYYATAGAFYPGKDDLLYDIEKSRLRVTHEYEHITGIEIIVAASK